MNVILQKVKNTFNKVYSSYMDSVSLCDPSLVVSSEPDLFVLYAGIDYHGITEDLKLGANYTQPDLI